MAAKKAAAKKKTTKAAAPRRRAPRRRKETTLVASATLRSVRISPQKARLVVNLVKGKEVERALDILQYSPKKAARLLSKLILSAIANAREKGTTDIDNLLVTNAYATAGGMMKRYLPRARGSANLLKKRFSHITVELGERGV